MHVFFAPAPTMYCTVCQPPKSFKRLERKPDTSGRSLVISNILSFLDDPVCLIRCSAVSLRWYRIVIHTQSLWKRFCLEVREEFAGLLDFSLEESADPNLNWKDLFWTHYRQFHWQIKYLGVAKDASVVKEAIAEAFESVTLPEDGTSISEARALDDNITLTPSIRWRDPETRSPLPWTAIPEATILALHDTLHFMNHAGFMYYAPAFMMVAFKHSDICRRILMKLTYRQAVEDWDTDPKKMKAVALFLQYMSEPSRPTCEVWTALQEQYRPFLTGKLPYREPAPPTPKSPAQDKQQEERSRHQKKGKNVRGHAKGNKK